MFTSFNSNGKSDGSLRSVFLGYTTKDGLTSTVKQVSMSAGTATPTPVPTSLNGGCILWNGINGYTPDSTLYYTTYSDGGSAGTVSSTEINFQHKYSQYSNRSVTKF